MCILKILPLFVILFLIQSSFSEISVRVFSKEEGLQEGNISKPRIYIENTGTEPISNFYYQYYFTTEDGKAPILEDYYTPNCAVRIDGSGSEYLVKYDYSGTTIQPGQIIPNTDGNCIGIRYDNWLPLDKTNDISNNLSSLFTLNGKIAVYLADGTQVYGNTPPDPENPPLPPAVNNSLGNFAVYSTEFTDIRDRARINGGPVGSATYTEAGCDAFISGGVISGGNIFLRERDTINGDAVAGEFILKQNNVVVTGTLREHAEINFPQIVTIPVTFGSTDITVNSNQSFDLTPGAYRDFHAYSRSTINVQPGDYIFRSFVTEPDVQIILKITQGQRIEFRIGEEMRLADRTNMSFESGIDFPLSFKVNSAQTSQLSIGTDGLIYGLFTAPAAEIHVNSRTDVYGALYGKRVVVEPEALVCKPPVLNDLWHSEWALSPSFDPAVFQYTAIVPDATATIKVTPAIVQGHTVIINGNSPGTPISLPVTENNISILLNSPEACGTTEYSLNVTKSIKYMVYVNDNSPCLPEKEDGETWGTAFKNLQNGINKALNEGKEIWVAEGIYKPTFRTEVSDPRSATFLIKTGIEIKGGFNGDETNSNPAGSLYNTILTGDLAGNDDSITVWPPAVSDSTYIKDNSYHVMTLKGYKSSKSVKLSNITVTGGIANGEGDNRNGAGILNKDISPTLELCNISRNYAVSSGAGIYDEGGTRSIINCLFKQNASVSGNGGGLYINNRGFLSMVASVFDSNMVIDTIDETGGGALFTSEISTQIINSIFTRNKVGNEGGAVYSSGSNVMVMNCTFANNTGLKGIGGIKNVRSTTNVTNTILYDFNGEVSDSGFTVTHSCVKGGHAGDGNISTDPNFLDINNPAGNDGRYGDKDDGLQLNTSSPCIDTGTMIEAPSTDILTVLRPARDGIDMGAYEYIDLDRRNKVFFGKFRNGVFYENDDLDRIVRMLHPAEIFQFSRSSYARVLRTYIEKNKYTQNKSELKIYVKPINADGSNAETEIEMKLYKIEEENGLLIFQSMTPDYKGKKILFTAEHGWHGCNNDWAYVLFMSDNPEINCRVPHDQFR